MSAAVCVPITSASGWGRHRSTGDPQVGKSTQFHIAVSPDARDHLRDLNARQRTTVLEAIEKQLSFEPDVPTRNRKLMRPNTIGTWELRVGNIRVYYDIVVDPAPAVDIRAIGIKSGDLVRITGEVVQL